jgi:hypothetical protein
VLALGVGAHAQLIEGGVPDEPIRVAEDLIACARPAGCHDAQALRRCIEELDQLPMRTATVLALAAVPGAIVTIHAPGVADPDVCASCGRRVSVSGCANIADAVAPYVPPPAYYAPLPYAPPPPPNVTGCVSYSGRWVNAAGCN